MKAGEDPVRFNTADSAWHLVIATVSHNAMLAAIMHSLGTLLQVAGGRGLSFRQP